MATSRIWCTSTKILQGIIYTVSYTHLVRRQAGKGNETAIVHNAFKLPHRFEELCNRFLVLYLFGDKEAPAKGGEITLHPATFLCGFRQEQVAGMIQERSFVEMPFKGTGKETRCV